MAVIIPSVIALGLGAFQAYKGSQKEKEARKLEAEAGDRPDYTTPQGAYDNMRLATARAQQGLSDQSIQYMTQANERGFGSALESILKGGGSQNNATDLYTASTDATAKLALANDKAQLQNIMMYMQQNQTMSDYDEKAWQLNYLDPWKDKMRAANLLQSQGQAQENAGYGTMASAAMTLSTNKSKEIQAMNAGKSGGGGGQVASSVVQLVTPQAKSNLDGMTAAAGTDMYSTQYGPNYPAGDYPSMNTNPYKPPTSMDLDWGKVQPENRDALYRILNNNNSYVSSYQA